MRCCRRPRTRLFTEQGYDATTVEQIAGEAGVSHMTFFRHFPTKDAVVLDDGFDPAIAAAVAATPATLSAPRRGCAPASAPRSPRRPARAGGGPAAGQDRRGHPALRAGTYATTEATREAIAEVLVGDGVDPFEARVASAAALAGLTVALLAWCQDEDDPMSRPARRGARRARRGAA